MMLGASRSAVSRRLDREIWKLSWPAVTSNLAVPLLGLSDTVITGHMGSSGYLGAIAVGATMLSMSYWLFGFLRMGTSGLTAQAYGMKDTSECGRLLSQAVCIGVAIGMLLIIFRGALADLIANAISADPEVEALAREYFGICIWGAPAMLGTMSVLGWMLGMQTTFWPMVISISVAIINVVLSLFFVFVMSSGFKGIALGTLLSVWIGFAVSLCLIRRVGKISFTWSLNLIFSNKGLGRFFNVNVDIFFRSGCIMAVSAAVVAIGAKTDTPTLAANAVIMQCFTLFSYFMDGLAFTGEALCGRYIGAGDKDLFKISVIRIFIWGGVTMLLFMLAYALFLKGIAGLITDREEVVETVCRYRLWVALIPVVSGAAFLLDGVFIGLTATRRMLMATAVAGAIFFLIVSLPGAETVEEVNSRLWTAFLVYLGLRGAILGVMLKGLGNMIYH